MGDLFQEVDPRMEAALVTECKKRGPDYTVRTATHWLTNLVNQQHFGFCTVPAHYEVVPDTDLSDVGYDKYPSRMVVEIDEYHVCRWCYLAEADTLAKVEGLPPVPRSEENPVGNSD